jgi:hypothetical protein
VPTFWFDENLETLAARLTAACQSHTLFVPLAVSTVGEGIAALPPDKVAACLALRSRILGTRNACPVCAGARDWTAYFHPAIFGADALDADGRVLRDVVNCMLC